ncbi:MAG TPA: MotA/TolQ/ExbB proton channel family protein [Thiotrichales bacterium]|nr:MAG: biopolymer transporter ExbB [Thiotrichales bacterium 39-47-5]HQR81753.1 MotA/TolQ/ExbB proton channel family protein [Thiotrichales bacterium]
MWLKPVGFLVLMLAIIGGFAIMQGPLGELWHPSELIVILGAALAAFLLAAPVPVVGRTFVMSLRYFQSDKANIKVYGELLGLLQDLFKLSRAQGVLALDKHISDPASSPVFARYPAVVGHKELLSFVVDCFSYVLMNPPKGHEIDKMAEKRISLWFKSASEVPKLTGKMGDWLPGFGIMAAIMGVILTMTTVGGPVEITAKFIGAALTGTFYGIFFAFAVVGPFTHALEVMLRQDKMLFEMAAGAITAYADGVSPNLAIEIGRQRVPPEYRDKLVGDA